MNAAAAPRGRRDAARARRLLTDIVQRHFGQPPRSVVECGGGLTNRVFEFKVAQGRFIVRTHENATKINDYLKERWAMDAAREAGVPTPRVLEVGNFADGRAYMVSERVDGVPGCDAPRRLALVEALGAAARALHRVPTHGWGPVFDWSGNALSRQDAWDHWLAHGFDVERRLAVLKAHRMLDAEACAHWRAVGAEMARWHRRPVLQHGDLRLKNVIADPAGGGRIAALLDWETATSLPAPHWDLSLALHELGVDEKEAFLAGYGMRPREWSRLLPSVRFFNVLNYAGAVEAAAACKDRQRMDALRSRLRGQLDLYTA